MFLILLNYIQPLDVIDAYVEAHRVFLDDGYKKNFFIASGPKVPRSGGVIISQLNDRAEVERLMQNDPFKIHNLADYEIIEFTPIKFHKNFAAFIAGQNKSQ